MHHLLHRRRQFLRQSISAATGLLLAPGLLACGAKTPASGKEGREENATDPSASRKIGVAILGLGGYAKGQIAPALQLTEHCELRGLITGSPEKLPEWQAKYAIKDENVYTYDTMEDIASNSAIDVIYVITPTATHRDFVIRAANAGKHVWCEKPMAMRPEDCQQMITACQQNGVKLSIGYRMLHEPNTQKLIELTRTQAYGPITGATSLAGYAGSLPALDYWRGQRAMGGGALYDMGVYTINGLRYGTQLMPLAVVSATQERPEDVDVTTTYQLEFPNGILANGKTSVVESYNKLRIEATNGWYELDPMQPYEGVQGSTSDGKILGPPVPNQQSLQMDADALAILNNQPVRAPGEEGLKDILIIRAIIESAETGKRVPIVF
ncbi:Gfo/Idh/MocA family oxidoreductase [Neolewinella lacunae]|uniref:Gfo/Idh/MocA family oxidoreductase n=1 Tax=Neolewinella lacunae TaxID=1517758 RepID=A0A923TBX1_9BACT|nr:Gfo/Idh/MocA family oxidoreductase [Neolewinella lacunae]MBC6993087.1 Gfo/Idh/MocA family oxidoreductase [Neolewinella lacunae]MDN3635907.1 Gfo/Idh/MocA family oxidoreductase [Neolewinella lacunae]